MLESTEDLIKERGNAGKEPVLNSLHLPLVALSDDTVDPTSVKGVLIIILYY